MILNMSQFSKTPNFLRPHLSLQVCCRYQSESSGFLKFYFEQSINQSIKALLWGLNALESGIVSLDNTSVFAFQNLELVCLCNSTALKRKFILSGSEAHKHFCTKVILRFVIQIYAPFPALISILLL